MSSAPDSLPPFVASPDTEILESISDSFVALDLQWRYLYVNAKAAELYGTPREALIGRNIWETFPEAIGTPFHLACQRALLDQCFIEMEDYYERAGRWFENRIYPSRRGLSVFFHDISDRKRAEAALRESEVRLRARETQLSLIFDNVSEVLFLLDVEADGGFRFVSVNRGFIRSTGLFDEAVIGRRVEEVIPAATLPLVIAKYREAIDTGKPVHWDEVTEYPTGTKHGEVTVAPVLDLAGRCTQLVGAVHDITERKRAERGQLESYARLQALSRELVELQDTEHRRLSAELHDRIGQNLTALSINLNILAANGPGDTAEASSARLADSRALLEATIGSVRDLITELRPVVLDDYGLLAGLKWSADRVQQRSGLNVRVLGDEAAPRLPVRIEAALFRVAQEALTNAVKHARAKTVTLKLTTDPGRARLIVTDDGAGFDPYAAAPRDLRAHLGLILMRERIESVGGSLAIDSVPGGGTRILAQVDLPA